MKLNQVIAIEKGAKAKAEKTLTESHHRCQKPELFAGIVRTYEPLDEAGEKLPDESQVVQAKVTSELAGLLEPLSELYDTVATKVITNGTATADVKVGDAVLVEKAPVELLLFLEKQLVNLHTYVAKLPVLHPGEEWHYDDIRDCFVTNPKEQVRTKKVMRNHVKAPATDKHPAQVEVYTEDVQIGTWTGVKFSGAMSAKERSEMLRRVEVLQAAVKMAREEANMADVKRTTGLGDRILRYLFSV